jgi:hypothetical protein
MNSERRLGAWSDVTSRARLGLAVVIVAAGCAGPAASGSSGLGPAVPASQPATSGASPAAVATSTATPDATQSPPPEDFTRVASFPGATAPALTAWAGGWAVIGLADAASVVWLSADGIVWERIVPAGLEDVAINHVVAIPDGRLLAFGFRADGSLGGAAEAWISSDGRTWEPLALGIADLVNSVDVAAGPLGLVMIGRAEPNTAGRNEYAWFSADGLVWDRVWETAGDEVPAAVASGPEGFVIVGQQGYEDGGDPIGLALASPDGREWIEASTDGPAGAASMVSVVPLGPDWMATSLGAEGVQVLRSPNGLDWTADTALPGAEARRGGIADLAGDEDFALLGSVLVPRTVLPVMMYTAGSGWQDTPATASGGISAASREGVTVLIVNTGAEGAPELQFWVAATPS